MTGGEGEVNVISLFNFVRPKAILVEKSVAVVFFLLSLCWSVSTSWQLVVDIKSKDFIKLHLLKTASPL